MINQQKKCVIARCISSDITVSETGLCYGENGEAHRIPYEEIIWVYIRKRAGKKSCRFYCLSEMTRDLRGDLIVIDGEKTQYLFREQYLNKPAGTLIEEMQPYDSSSFLGYDAEIRELYQEEFDQMKKMCRIMRRVCRDYISGADKEKGTEGRIT